MAEIGIVGVLLLTLPTGRHGEAAYHTPKVIRPQIEDQSCPFCPAILRASHPPPHLLLFLLTLC